MQKLVLTSEVCTWPCPVKVFVSKFRPRVSCPMSALSTQKCAESPHARLARPELLWIDRVLASSVCRPPLSALGLNLKKYCLVWVKKKFHLSKVVKIDPPGLDRASDPEPHNDRHTEVSRSRVATGQSAAEGSVLGLSKKSNHVQQ